MGRTGFKGHYIKKPSCTEEERQSTQYESEEEDITMGEILLPGDKGFVSVMVQTGGVYEEVVENLNDKMNGASREKSDVPMDGEDDDDETSSDEDDEDEEADVVTTRNKARDYYENQKKL